MSLPDDAFLNTLRATFSLEAAEHVHAMASGLLDLEKSPEPETRQRLVDHIFRAAHSLKGAARAVDILDVEGFCQALEDQFAAWRSVGYLPSRTELDDAHAALDAISKALAPTPAAASPAPSAPARSHSIEPAAAPLRASAPTVLSDETVRIAVSRLDGQLLDAEEMLATKLMTAERARDLRAVAHQVEGWRKEWLLLQTHLPAVRPAIAQIADSDPRTAASVSRVIDFLDWTVDYQKTVEARLASLCRTADHDTLAVSKLVGDLLANSKKLLLLPFGTLAAHFPKMVRDLSRDQHKEVDVLVTGDHIDIDKRILDEIKDPIIHLLRNAVDHGIETPELRAQCGKPAHGTIRIDAAQVDGSNVQIVLADDGAGIDPLKVRSAAVDRSVLSAAQADELDDSAATQLIFEPEVSTSTTLTRLSGRGLGLAIVREKTERLGGRVSVESQAGQGTRFTLILPSMLATFRGILVASASGVFVVPTSQVERVVRVRRDAIGTVEGRQTVSLAGKAVAFVRLRAVLQLPADESEAADDAHVILIVLGSGDQQIAFEVDDVLDEQEVIVKPLRKPLVRVNNIAGATILPSGQVVPILNVADLLKSARRTTATAPVQRPATASVPKAKSILVAEDSITSRMLMKTILEAAGYKVSTAVDGIEAFALLRGGGFDLLVSDVEMPRLNGFDLTARIRADKRLAELPVVLVTALETPEHRSRGIDTGADAYIVKSGFDKRDLLDAVRRLV